MESFEILKIAANALNAKKGREIAAVKIDKLTVLADYFLFCTANSSTQVRALCDEVEEKLEEVGITPHHIEGRTTGWILLDYNSVLVHIFTGETRDYYNLERLWQDAPDVDISDIVINTKGKISVFDYKYYF